MRFDNADSLPNGTPASALFGQANYWSNFPTTFQTPIDVLPTKQGVFVSDRNRVVSLPCNFFLPLKASSSHLLLFSSDSQLFFSADALTGSNTPPIGVYGQGSISTSQFYSHATPYSLSSPYGLAAAADGTLFVSDTGKNRIVIFAPLNVSEASQGFANLSAIAVIGAPSLYGNGTLTNPTMLAFDDVNSCLWVVSNSPAGSVLRYPYVFAIPVNNSGGVQLSFEGRTPTFMVSPKG